MARRLTGRVAERLNATVHGEGEAWLVLSHGFGTSQSVWEPIITRYGRHRRILTYDLAYIEQSGEGSPLYGSLSTYADDLIALLDEQNIHDATVLGHSASGMISLLAAVVEPAFFRDLVLLNASPRYLDDIDYKGGMTAEELEANFAAIRQAYAEWVLAFAPAVTAASEGPGLSEFVKGLLGLRPDVAVTVLRSIYDADLRRLLPEISCPVEILQSRVDVAVPVEVGQYMAARIPSSRLVLLDAEGHLPHLTAPERLWPALDVALLGGV